LRTPLVLVVLYEDTPSTNWTQIENCVCRFHQLTFILCGSCIRETIRKVRNTNVIYTRQTHTYDNSLKTYSVYLDNMDIHCISYKTTTYYLFYKCTIFGSNNIHIFCIASTKIYTPTSQQWSSHTNWKPIV